MGYILCVSLCELGFLIFFFLIGVILFSLVVYYVEGVEGEFIIDFKSIFDVFWWVVVIMMMVGYGDMKFIIVWGKIVGYFWC